MKKILYILFMMLPVLSWGQFGQITPNSGIYIPNLDRTVIPTSSLSNGLAVFDVTTKSIWYYKDAVTGWVEISNSGSGSGGASSWLLNGNSLSGSEFIGSTNSQDVVFKRTNIESLRIMTGGAMVFKGDNTGITPVSGAGTRMMWIPSKAAFRTGSVSGTEWDNANIGYGSIAGGSQVKASADYSTAFGVGAEATGQSSVAIGNGVFATSQASVAIGSGATASTGWGAMAFTGGTASGISSFAWGNAAKAIAQGAMAMGSFSEANQPHSIALKGGKANGWGSVAIGVNCNAQLSSSYAIGTESISSAQEAIAIGTGLNAHSYGMVAVGRYNNHTANPGNTTNWGSPNTYPLFVVGNGLSNTSRSNAFIVVGTGNTGIRTTAPRASLDVVGTDAIIVPVGTTAQRPTTPTVGMIRYNTTTKKYEGYAEDSTTPGTFLWVGLH